MEGPELGVSRDSQPAVLPGLPGNTDQLDFHLFGSAGRLAAFYDILFPRSGRLDHLINRAIRPGQKPVTKPISEIVNNLGLSIRNEFAVVAVRGE